MNNKIVIDNPIKQKLNAAALLCLLMCVIFASCTLAIANIAKKNLNGITQTTEGVLEEISNEDDVIYITVDGKQYTTAVIAEYYNNHNATSFADFIATLKGKTVQVVTPETQVGSVAPWVLGLSCEGEAFFDTEEILQLKRKENKIIVNVFVVVCALLVAAAIVLETLKVLAKPTKEYPLAQKYSDFFLTRQPSLPKLKLTGWVDWLALGTTVAAVIAIIIMGVAEASDTAAIIAVITIAVLYVVLFVLKILTVAHYNRLSIDFYAENFPFDFTDISHLKMKKAEKEELQRQLIEERKKFPHRYADGGNDYEAEFTDNGVALRVPEFLREPDVFDELETENLPVLTIPYDELNFEAVAFYYPSGWPMNIVVKSRLQNAERYQQYVLNDLHFLLDSNLQNTLKTFNVTVENLDSLLQNKKQLMLKNCRKRKRRQ